MTAKRQRKTFLVLILCLSLMGPNCTGKPTGKGSPAPPAVTPVSSSWSTSTLTPVPGGVFSLFFYPPLIMNYDPSIWEDKSNYTEWGLNLRPEPGVVINNYLQAVQLSLCQIGVIGSSGYFPATENSVELGDVRYQFLTSEDQHLGLRLRYYLEDQSLPGYDYSRHGLPVLQITATPQDWGECKAIGEKVLSALHVP